MWYTNTSVGIRRIIFGSALVSLITAGYLWEFVHTKAEEVSAEAEAVTIAKTEQQAKTYLMLLKIRQLEGDLYDRHYYGEISSRHDLDYQSDALASLLRLSVRQLPLSDEKKKAIISELANGNLSEVDASFGEPVLPPPFIVEENRRLLRALRGAVIKDDQLKAYKAATDKILAIVNDLNKKVSEIKPIPEAPSLWSRIKTEVAFWTPLFVSIGGMMISAGTLTVSLRQHRFNVEKAERESSQKPKQQPLVSRRRIV